jgi:uncharacterized membrane protein
VFIILHQENDLGSRNFTFRIRASMNTDLSQPYYGLSTRPVYALLVQFPVVCFIGALATDIAYLETELYLWETFSVWLLAAGCVMAGLAGIAALFSFVSDGRVRAAPLAWPHALLGLLAALLSVVNAFVHSRDGYTAVVPTGLTLSAVVVALMLVVTWMGWQQRLVQRQQAQRFQTTAPIGAAA